MDATKTGIESVIHTLQELVSPESGSRLSEGDRARVAEAIGELRAAAVSEAAVLRDARAWADRLGLKPGAVDSFAGTERTALIVQAALWHSAAVAAQRSALDADLRSGEVISRLLDHCKANGLDVPDDIADAVCSLGDQAPAPASPSPSPSPSP